MALILGGEEQVSDKFWTPEFEVEYRDDGSIIMRHTDPEIYFGRTIPDSLVRWAQKTPDHDWLAQRNEAGTWDRLTYGDALPMLRKLGATFLNMGLTADRPVLILSENSIDHGVVAMACQYVGIPGAAVSTAYALLSDTHDKLRDVAGQLNAGAIYASDGAAYGPAIAAVAGPDTHIIVSKNPAEGMHLLSDLTHADIDLTAADAAFADLSGDTVAKYLFTSGSTGSPKAVINTQSMLTSNMALAADCFRFLAFKPPVLVDWAPWSHTASGNKAFNIVITNGGTFYIDEGKPTPKLIGKTIANLREIAPSWYFNVPVGYEMLVQAMREDDQLRNNFFSNLDMMMYAGAGMAQHTWEDLLTLSRETTGHEVLLTTALGATETGPLAMIGTTQQEKPGNVGVPVKGVTLKLVPNEDKLEARIKSPSVTRGYLNDPAKTAEAFDDEGFYCLGDALRPVDMNDLTKGFLFDGRIAENFKLSTGTWVAVGALRASMVDHFDGLIRDAVIVGENRDELGAMVFPADPDAEPDLATYQTALDAFNAKATGSSNRVRRLVVLREVPSLDKGEATDKGSINQRAVIRHRPEAVEVLFDGERGVKTY